MIKLRVRSDSASLVRYAQSETSLNYNALQKLLRNKDIKLNNVRISRDVPVHSGDEIVIYNKELSLKVYFSDSNILILYKPKGIECEGSGGFEELVQKEYPTARICHRLDRNTDGLIIFALNPATENAMQTAIKNNQLIKKYTCQVFGQVEEISGVIKVYLRKDTRRSLVTVYDSQVAGSVYAETIYELDHYSSETDISTLDVTLVTGRTHQIRCSLAHIGYPVVGDMKYGDPERNRRMNKEKQCLTARSISFRISPDNPLRYLNSVSVTL